MFWTAWAVLIVATGLSAAASFLSYAKGRRASIRTWITLVAAVLALASLVLGLVGHAVHESESVPAVLSISLSVLFALAFGGPFTELVFTMASRVPKPPAKEKSDPSPLRGGLWIGLLERAAIVGTLWAGWPEGTAVVLAVKGLGRFAELKNHQAAEQFILGTFASGLVAAGAYGLGLLLS